MKNILLHFWSTAALLRDCTITVLVRKLRDSTWHCFKALSSVYGQRRNMPVSYHRRNYRTYHLQWLHNIDCLIFSEYHFCAFSIQDVQSMQIIKCHVQNDHHFNDVLARILVWLSSNTFQINYFHYLYQMRYLIGSYIVKGPFQEASRQGTGVTNFQSAGTFLFRLA